MVRVPLSHHSWLWDLLIALLLTLTLAVGAAAWGRFDGTLAWVIPSITGGIVLILLYASFVEPKTIKLNKKCIQLGDLPDLSIAIIADFHVGPYKGSAFVRRMVERVNRAEPDLILLPGDFVFDHRSDLSALLPLQDLRARYGVLAVLGNHDSGQHVLRGRCFRTLDRSEEITSFLRTLDITVLRNASTVVNHQGCTITVLGIDDVWMQSSDLTQALDDAPADGVRILLAHNPDVILDTQSHAADLIVSGHTHGGQVRLPWWGAVAPIPNETGTCFDHGVFALREGPILAITHGIGETMARCRLFCPPEILLLTHARNNEHIPCE